MKSGYAVRLSACVLVWGLGTIALADTPPADRHVTTNSSDRWSGRNLIANGGFELDADSDGTADDWSFSGDPKGLTVKLALDTGRTGGKSQRMTCTRFKSVSGWTHVMLCQVGKVSVKKGYGYTLRFWAKAKDITDMAVGVGVQDTDGWKPLGMRSSFVPTAKWEPYEFRFVAEGDCAKSSRLQIWFNSTGTLWIDDAEMTEHPPQFGLGARRPTKLYKPGRGGNLIPNAGFEVGRAGWGSESRHYYGWGTPMSRLLGHVVDGGVGGGSCLKIDIAATSQPVAYFDYFEPVRQAIEAPLAGHQGFVALKPKKDYVLSAWLKAASADTPVRLGVRYFDEWFHEKVVSVGTTWKRYDFRFRARRGAGYAIVGPDLRGAKRQTCTVWIDNLHLVAGKDPTAAFSPRAAVEAALATQRDGNIFFDGEAPKIRLTAHNAGSKPTTVRVEVKAVDFWDRPVATKTVTVELPAARTVQQRVDLQLNRRGFYRVTATSAAAEVVNDLRVAIIPKYRRTDSIIGINHAYGWDYLARPCVAAGILWARDWSLKWQHVEPVKGRFDFSRTDPQIDRALRLGHSVLALLPFPSSNWSSSAPESVKATTKYPQSLNRLRRAPRDEAEFAEYVTRCVKQRRGRIRWWQCFNEPLYTNYSLPRKDGYTAADYVRLVKAFHKAAKAADPNCKVLAGPGGWTTGSGRDLQAMLAAGMADHCDAIDLHTYPGLRPPEAFKRDLAKINALMDAAGGRKPLWLTEHGYYADDDLVAVPPKSSFIKLLPNERIQAEYSIRFNLVLLAGGVRKIFYHAGSSPGLNVDHPQSIFFDYDGQPRKVFAAIAAFCELFGPNVQFVRNLSETRGRQVMLFRDGKRLILAAWHPKGRGKFPVRPGRGISVRDMLGNAIAPADCVVSPSPVFVVGDGLTPVQLLQAVPIGPAEPEPTGKVGSAR